MGRTMAVDPRASLRIEYLSSAKEAPQVLRMADVDERYCVGMQQVYLCSEKRKVRTKTTGGGGDAAADAERRKRCKQADRQRHAVQTRVEALERASNRTSASALSSLSSAAAHESET